MKNFFLGMIALVLGFILTVTILFKAVERCDNGQNQVKVVNRWTGTDLDEWQDHEGINLKCGRNI